MFYCWHKFSAEKCEFIKNSVVLGMRLIYNIGVVGCLLEDDYIHRYDYRYKRRKTCEYRT